MAIPPCHRVQAGRSASTSPRSVVRDAPGTESSTGRHACLDLEVPPTTPAAPCGGPSSRPPTRGTPGMSHGQEVPPVDLSLADVVADELLLDAACLHEVGRLLDDRHD